MACLQEYLIYTAIGSVLIVVFFLSLDRHRRDTVYRYVGVPPRGRRISSSKTPPRSLSPERKVPTNAPHVGDYKDVFPPPCREALASAAKTLSKEQQRRLRGNEIDHDEFKKNIIPFTADYRECGPSSHTCMKISMDEVRALGDFPNYAELCGVPLPQHYKEFKIETAMPRPYRPFRWAYHQTMCKSRSYKSHAQF